MYKEYRTNEFKSSTYAPTYETHEGQIFIKNNHIIEGDVTILPQNRPSNAYYKWNIEFVKLCIGRGWNEFENLCPIPLIKYSIKYVQTKPQNSYRCIYIYMFIEISEYGYRIE